MNYRVLVLIIFLALASDATRARADDEIWITRAQLASLPRSGPAWENLLGEAQRAAATPDLEDPDDPTNVNVLAKALVFAATNQGSYRTQVATALRSIVNSGTYVGRALALGRELAAYVIAADLIDLRHYDPDLDQRFRAKLRELRITPTDDGPDDLLECSEERANNWGLHCAASRIAVARYLGDSADVAASATRFHGWLGNRAAYQGFEFGSPSWQGDRDNPVGVNKTGATIQGHPVGGVLPEEQRRSGGFSWPPPKASYVYEGLQGALAQAILLSRAGYDVWQWEDQALLRAFTWLYTTTFQDGRNFPAEGDDRWQPHVVNFFYGTTFPAVAGVEPGKAVGWTDWTHSGQVEVPVCSARTARVRSAAGPAATKQMTLRATFVLPVSGLGGFLPEDDGLSVTVTGDGTELVSAVASDGAFDGTSGWSTNRRGNRWTYVDKGAKAAGAGVMSVQLATGSDASPSLAVTVKLIGSYAWRAGDGSLTVTLQHAAGQGVDACSAFLVPFGAEQCAPTTQEPNFKCRGGSAS